MAFDIQVSTGSSVPIYRQISDQIRRDVSNGGLELGDQLPSVRQLAERLLLNPNTVAKAYNELVRDGVIESRHGKGVFVARKRQLYTKAERVRRLDRALDSLLSEVLALDLGKEEVLDAVARKLDQLAARPGASEGRT